jgi:hypothetical protein
MSQDPPASLASTPASRLLYASRHFLVLSESQIGLLTHAVMAQLRHLILKTMTTSMHFWIPSRQRSGTEPHTHLTIEHPALFSSLSKFEFVGGVAQHKTKQMVGDTIARTQKCQRGSASASGGGAGAAWARWLQRHIERARLRWVKRHNKVLHIACRGTLSKCKRTNN